MTTATETFKGDRVTTPNGITIEYEAQPKRLYRVDGVEVPSVTSVLGVLSKGGGLNYWAQGIGANGVLELIRQGKVGRDGAGPCTWHPDHGVVPATQENVVQLLKDNNLSWNNLLNKAGDRGVSVHAALEAWANDRTQVPDPQFYPPEEQGYIEGLRQFIGDVVLSPRPAIAAEVMVGSKEHGFAGRYDLRMTIQECELVVKRTPVRGETREVFKKGARLIDAKSTGSVYPTHFIQLEGYEGASIEDGLKPTLERLVLRLDKEGWYEVRRSTATYTDFLSVLGTYNTLQSLKGRK